MSWGQTLLTAEASPAERAVESVSAARWPLQWDLLRTLQNADTIPEDKLAILAWAMSVDIWDPAWHVEKKRSVVRQAVKDHSLKGTIAGVRRYLSIEDATLVQYLAPPQMLFAGPSLTKAELEAWLETMPQIRIRHRSRPILDPLYSDGFLDAMFLDADFLGFDIGAAIYGRQAFLFDNGEEVALRNVEIIKTAETVSTARLERASIPGIAGKSMLGADFFGDLFLDDTVLEPELYTYSLDQSYVNETSELAFNAVPVSLSPVTTRYTRDSEVVQAGAAMFVSEFWDDALYFEPDQGAFMVFDSIRLHDPRRTVPFIQAVSFFDFSRYGMPAFTAEYMVDVPNALPQDAMAEGDYFDQGFLVPTNTDKIDRALDAVDIAKGYRDKALVTFETTRARTWGDGLPLDGSVKIGDRLPATL